MRAGGGVYTVYTQETGLPAELPRMESAPLRRIPRGGNLFRRSFPGRFALCAALSTALHAALFLIPPYPAPGRDGDPSGSILQVRMGTARPVKGSPGPFVAAEEPSLPVPETARALPEQDASPPTPTTGGPEAAETPYEGETGEAGAALRAATGGPDADTEPPRGDRAEALLRERVRAALAYPEAARRRGIEGVVGLSIRLDENGGLAGLRVTISSGSPLLDQAAREAVVASLPFPALSGSPRSYDLAVRFGLRDAKR